MGLLLNILASYLSIGVSVAILALLLITVVATYTLILTPKVRQVAIYANLMVNRYSECIHFSASAPLAIQYAELLWKALAKDGSPLTGRILKNLHRSESDALSLDLIEYLVFLVVLSGFEVFWASGTIKSYGYPTWPSHLGEVPRFRPSTIYVIFTKETEAGPKERQFEYKDIRPMIQGNQLVEHFLGDTSLERIYSPRNWLIFTPKGTQISIQRTGRERIIRLSNRYSTISLNIVKASVGAGLPYGIRIKEKEYDEKRFFTTDFRIDFKASFSRLLSLHPRMDDYYNWTHLILRKLVANFSLSRKGVIEEIE